MRNPLIADTCFKAGYIDSWGRGTIKIIEACKESGLPEPVLKDEQGGFLSKIFKSTEKVRRKYGDGAKETGDPLSSLKEKHKSSMEEVRRKFGEKFGENTVEEENYGRITEEIRKKYGRNHCMDSARTGNYHVGNRTENKEESKHD